MLTLPAFIRYKILLYTLHLYGKVENNFTYNIHENISVNNITAGIKQFSRSILQFQRGVVYFADIQLDPVQ